MEDIDFVQRMGKALVDVRILNTSKSDAARDHVLANISRIVTELKSVEEALGVEKKKTLEAHRLSKEIRGYYAPAIEIGPEVYNPGGLLCQLLELFDPVERLLSAKDRAEINTYKQFYIHGGISGQVLAQRVGVSLTVLAPILDEWDDEHNE